MTILVDLFKNNVTRKTITLTWNTYDTEYNIQWSPGQICASIFGIYLNWYTPLIFFDLRCEMKTSARLSRARSHLCSAGPAPPTPPSLPGLPARLAWELLLIGKQCENTWSKSQIFKLTTLSLFPSWLMEFLHMPKELNGLSDWVLSHWYPTRRSSHVGAGRKTGQWSTVKEAWEGWDPTKWRCDVAQGQYYSLWLKKVMFLNHLTPITTSCYSIKIYLKCTCGNPSIW
jgi:hypothetical protein